MTAYSPIFADDCASGAAGHLLQVAVNLNTMGDHTVIPGVLYKVIRVHRVRLTSMFLLATSFKSGLTLLSGPEYLYGQLLDLDMEHPWYTTLPGDPLVINLATSVQLGGTLWYTQPAA